MVAHIHFEKRNGDWGFIVRERWSLFLSFLKTGGINAIDANTISSVEEKILHKEGFSLIPEAVQIGHQKVKILKLERA